MIVLVSADGYVKRMPLSLGRTHQGGTGKTITAGWVRLLKEPEGDYDILILTNLGGLTRFPLKEIRPMGEMARGVKVIQLQSYESVQDAIIMGRNEEMLTPKTDIPIRKPIPPPDIEEPNPIVDPFLPDDPGDEPA